MGRRRSWEPPDDLQTHSGEEIDRDADFFADPPEELGELLSAHTTLTFGKEPVSLPVRLVVSLLVAMLGAAVGTGIVVAAGVETVFWMLVWPVGLALIGGAIALLFMGFSHTCTYVGREGVVKFTCSGSRDSVREELFRFRDATELRTSQTRRYTNGVYQGTDYSYTWTDVNERPCHVISGTHNSEQGTPPDKDLYHYAIAAEIAWSTYLFDDAERQLMTKGEVRFRLGGGDWVAVGKGYLRLRLGGVTVERDRDDIEAVTIQQGTFKVVEVGGREGWFSSKGVFKFDYTKLANARLFLFLLEKVAGLPVD